MEEKQAGQKKQNELQPITKNRLQEKNWPMENKKSLSQALGMMCSVQKNYGKSEIDLHNMVEAYAYFLREFTLEQVINAIEIYMETHDDLPTPANIRAIICPPVKLWEPDWAVYNSFKEELKKGGRYALGPDEYQYIRMCEEFSQKGLAKFIADIKSGA